MVCGQLYHIISVYFTVYSIMQNYSCGRFLTQGALMHCIDARFMEWTPAPALLTTGPTVPQWVGS